jgi:hypothetical protein
MRVYDMACEDAHLATAILTCLFAFESKPSVKPISNKLSGDNNQKVAIK